MVAMDGAPGPQLPREAPALAQQPSLGVTAAFAQGGELRRHEREARKIGHELLLVVGRCENDAERSRAREPALALGAKLRQREHQGAVVGGGRGAIAGREPLVADYRAL